MLLLTGLELLTGMPAYQQPFNSSTTGKFAPILPVNQAIISAVGGKYFFFNCHCQKQANLFLSQLFPFPSIVLTVLENGVAKGKTCETTEYKPPQYPTRCRCEGA